MSTWRDLVGAGAACAPDESQNAASSSSTTQNPLSRLANSVLSQSQERNSYTGAQPEWQGQEEALLFGDPRSLQPRQLSWQPYGVPRQPNQLAYPPPMNYYSGQSEDFVSEFLSQGPSAHSRMQPNMTPLRTPGGYSSWAPPQYASSSLFSWIPEYGQASWAQNQPQAQNIYRNEEEIFENAFSGNQQMPLNRPSVNSLVQDYVTSTVMQPGLQQAKDISNHASSAMELAALRKRSEEMARTYFPDASEQFIQAQVDEFLQSLNDNSDWISEFKQETDPTVRQWHEEFSNLHLKDSTSSTEEWVKELENEQQSSQSWAEEFQHSNLESTWEDEYIEKNTFEDTFEDDLQRYLGRDPNELEYEFTEENPYLGDANAMAEGERLYAEGSLQQAVLAFEAAVRMEPNNAKGWFLLGRTHTELDQDNPAIICLRRSIEVGGEVADALLELGVSYTNELNHSQALTYLRRWLESQPKYQEFCRRQPSDDAVTAHAYIVEQFRAACTAFPHDVNLYIVLGVLHNLSRDYELAVEVFGKAIQLQPNDHRLWNKLGATLANSYQSREALSAYRRAVDLKPSYVRAWVNVGTSYANQGIYEQACRYYLKALQMNPRINHVWNYLRTSFIAMGRNDLLALTDQHDANFLLQALDSNLSAAWQDSLASGNRSSIHVP
eukprot:jgi/Galph1/3510/GphlegSOOS_G2131.1